ncbi:MAG TPA: HD domain-containing protein [Hyphomicrobiaceae bacterium]|nr:HD domain-containing protein [Hyphomicrobiaceae bacterium]
MARKPPADGNGAPGRAITDALRAQVREELPEVAQIANPDLQAKTVEAWAYALAHSTFRSIRDIPPAGNPDTNEAKRGDQTDHLRGVTRLAVGIAREMGAAYPELAIDMDTIVSGGLVHDVGKAWEFDPANRRRWKASQRRTGRPSIRHPAYGAHICLTVGLPEEVAHIAMAHSGEGELLVRSLECMIVHQADYTFWYTLLAGGQLKPETVPPDRRKYVIDRPF